MREMRELLERTARSILRSSFRFLASVTWSLSVSLVLSAATAAELQARYDAIPDEAEQDEDGSDDEDVADVGDKLGRNPATGAGIEAAAGQNLEGGLLRALLGNEVPRVVHVESLRALVPHDVLVPFCGQAAAHPIVGRKLGT